MDRVATDDSNDRYEEKDGVVTGTNCTYDVRLG